MSDSASNGQFGADSWAASPDMFGENFLCPFLCLLREIVKIGFSFVMCVACAHIAVCLQASWHFGLSTSRSSVWEENTTVLASALM